jgi:conjugative relaxase-like TrwC/TraI family protein
LTVAVVGPGAHRYYVDEAVPGVAEGTGIRGEPPGRWVGGGAARLDLTGTVEASDLEAVLTGERPGGGPALRAGRGPRPAAGYDLVFAAPKSVSILGGLGRPEVAEQAIAGHDAAVRAATGYLDDVAVTTRRHEAGEVRMLGSRGMAAASFRHRTSRALDPHLHTHVVVANAVEGADGRWTALYGRRLFGHVAAAGAVYRSELRAELSHRLGVAWDHRGTGGMDVADVAGVDPVLRAVLSSRHASIREQVEMVGTGRTTAYHRTRPEKVRGVDVAAMVPRWRAIAADFGVDTRDVDRVVGRGLGAGRAPSFEPERVAVRAAALAGRGRRVAHRDVVAMVAAAHRDGGRAADVVDAATAIFEGAGGLGRGRIVPRGVEARVDAGALRDVVREVGAELSPHLPSLPARPPRTVPGRGRERRMAVDAGRSTGPRGAEWTIDR